MTALSVVPARLEYACGHHGLVSLPPVKGEKQRQRTERVDREKASARLRSCDFCGPSVSVAAAVEIVTASNGEADLSTAVTLHASDTLTLVNNGHPAVGQPESTPAVPTAGSMMDQKSPAETEPTLRSAAQQRKRTRSARATQLLRADAEPQPAQLDGAAESRPTRSRLSVDQQREVAQLYAGTNTLTSEIHKPFGISEASVYRIVQRQGVPLRGRGGSPTPGQAPTPATQPRALAATVPTPPAGARRRGRAAVRRTKPSASRRTASGGAGARRQFRIQFHGERVIQALHIRDALRQAELLGAIEITEIAQAD